MPTRRRSYKRRRVTRFRRRSTRSRGTRSLATKALSLASRVYKSRETKQYTPTNFSTSNLIGRDILTLFYAPHSDIVRGTQDFERIGDKITNKYLYIRGAYRVSNINLAAVQPQRANVITFWCALYRRPDLTTPATDVSRIFENYNQDNASVYAFKQWDNRLNVKLLMRKYVVITSETNLIRPFVYRIRLPFSTQYDNTNFIQRNKIYFGWISNQAVGEAGSNVILDFKWRLTYTDS